MTKQTPHVVYLYYGQDEPSLKDSLSAFRAGLFEDPAGAELNTIILDGRTAQLGEIEMSASALPFLAGVRAIFVKNITDSAGGRALIDKLPELFPRLPDWARLVFVETGLGSASERSGSDESSRPASRRTALKKLISAVDSDPRGKIFGFEVPEKSPGWVHDWIIKRASHFGAAIDSRAAQVLASRTNEDLNLADIELQKLAVYTNLERPITADDVNLLTPYDPEASIFDMVDAVGQRNGGLALKLLHRLLDEGDDPLRIFGMIIRQYRLLLLMREQLDNGVSPASAGPLIGVKNVWLAGKIATQAQTFSLEVFERIYRHLLGVDLSMKTGETQPQLALETLIAQLARQ
jgi:DNA polymerase-3 subunit delta